VLYHKSFKICWLRYLYLWVIVYSDFIGMPYWWIVKGFNSLPFCREKVLKY